MMIGKTSTFLGVSPWKYINGASVTNDTAVRSATAGIYQISKSLFLIGITITLVLAAIKVIISSGGSARSQAKDVIINRLLLAFGFGSLLSMTGLFVSMVTQIFS